MTGPHEPAVRKPHGVRIDKFGVGVNQIEPTRLEGPYAVVCELGDDLFLARVDRLHVRAGRGNLESEDPSLLREVEDLGHVEERLGWHAAAENAQPTEFPGPIDDGRLESKGNGDARGIKPRASSANRHEVVAGSGFRGASSALGSHGRFMSKQADGRKNSEQETSNSELRMKTQNLTVPCRTA